MCPRILIAATLVATACSPSRPPAAGESSTVDGVALARAHTAAGDLGRDLMELLTSELRRGGPGAAIAVCADSAQRRTARHNAEGTVVRELLPCGA